MSDLAYATASALLLPREMAAVDRAMIGSGTSGIELMERAGAAVAQAAERLAPTGRIAVLAGPGNNGGDGWVAARLLRAAGRDVRVFTTLAKDALAGDAALSAAAFEDAGEPLARFVPDGFALVIDALFGAGLSRAPDADTATVIALLNAAGIPVLAVDLPSGVSGADGSTPGAAVKASATVTFFRRKPGHLLYPGRALCGPVEVGDIGIPPSILADIRPTIFANEPPLWIDALKRPNVAGHKYDRGHAVVFSGSASKTGAARLAAMAALRGGAGLVTVFSPASAVFVHAAHLTAVMVRRCDDAQALVKHLEDARLNAYVLGPGFGAGERARDYALAVLAAGRSLVLDADGLTSFADMPDQLFAGAKAAPLVLTPHDGEFKRLFPDLAGDEHLSKLDRCRQAARRSGAVVVLKGADTVIADATGRTAINASGTPWLATAGTGDVLAGLVGAQLAQGTPAFEAACAAVWMHGRTAEHFGPGLISEDLPAMLPKVHAELE